MVFVDSGAIFTLLVPNDANHIEARRWFDTNRQRLITTDYILDETLTLLKARREFRRLPDFESLMVQQELIAIEWVRWDDFQRAWEIFKEFADKEWSFTDCVSRVVMERLGVAVAFTFDHHFNQFGTVAVVPGGA